MTTEHELTIGVDARLSGQKHAGIGRYIENLLMQLPETAINHSHFKINWVYFFYDRKQAEPVQQALENYNNLTFVYTPIRHYSLKEQLKWPRILNKHDLDLLHVPHFNIPLLYGEKIVITIHDLLWHQQVGPAATTLPGWKYYLKYSAYRLVTTKAIKRAVKIFVPTQTVKQTLTEHYPKISDKTIVAKEGVSRRFSQIYQQIKDQSRDAAKNFDKQTLIYVGSLYPHKNIEVVLQALKKDSSLNLVIVCARNVFMQRTKDRIKHLSLQDQVKFTGYLADKELAAKLQTALALIQPSKSEGFGLTGVEAMACGTPVIASNIPVFKEIYQEAPLYFNPDNPDELLKAVEKLKQTEVRQKAVTEGFKVVQDYSWQNMADMIFKNYLEILNKQIA